MKTKRVIIGIASLIVASGLLFTSCRKKKEEEQDTDTAAASDNSYAERLTNDMAAIGDQAGGSGGLTTYKLGLGNAVILSPCAVVSFYNSNTTNTDTVTVDFGLGCMGSDGKFRQGMIRYTYTGGNAYRDSGIVITMTPVNYKVDGNAISGSKSITNQGRINGIMTWAITANITIVKANNGGTVTWNCTRTKRLLNTSTVFTNYATPINWASARIGITGTASGVTANGTGYSADVTSELIRDFGLCNGTNNRVQFIQGTIKFKPDDKTLWRYIDFGNGACDNVGTFTIGNWSTTFTLN